MTILIHGSDLRLAPTLRPIVKQTDGTVAAALDALAKSGFTSVQFDAALPGIRPRELSQRDRRDLIAMIRRAGLDLAGLDLFIPRKHYVESQHQDRAVEATLAAIQLAADLGRVPLSINLPGDAWRSEVTDAIVQGSDGHSVPLAIHSEDKVADLLAWLEELDQPLVGAGLDPAAVLAWGQNPTNVTHSLSRRLLVGRLSDLQRGGEADLAQAGGVRCPVGEGELSLRGYRVALDLCPRRVGPVVLDLRSLEAAVTDAVTARTAWDDAAALI